MKEQLNYMQDFSIYRSTYYKKFVFIQVIFIGKIKEHVNDEEIETWDGV